MRYEYPEWDVSFQIMTKGSKKNNIIRDIQSNEETCREILLENVCDDLPLDYKWFRVYSIYKIGKKQIYNDSKIIFTTQSPEYYQYYSKKENLLLLEKLLNIIIGTMGVCIYDTDMDIKWRKSDYCNLILKFIIDGDEEYQDEWNCFGDIIYKGVPPSYMMNPISASLILGLIRDCYNLCFYKPKICKKFVDDRDYNKILKMIKTSNLGMAEELYIKTIEPFLLKVSTLDRDLLIRNKSKNVVRDFIHNGMHRLPEELSPMLWDLANNSFGFTSYYKSLGEDI